MNALICGGGTAGHVNPGVAIADALSGIDKTCKVAFVGRLGGDEYKLVEERSIPLYRLRAEGFDRRHPVKNIKTLSTLTKSVFEAKKIIKDFEPDVIIGTGGYVCAPVILGGRFMKIPTVLHESNAYPGLTTRLLSPLCDSVLLNFEACSRHLKNKKNFKVVGNPLLFDFGKITKDEARRKLGIGKNDYLIVSFGGSGGAEAVNKCIIELMKAYSTKNSLIKHIHAVGNKYYPEIKKNESNLCRGSHGCKILPYIENMPVVMNAADLVISRCGAMTLSEISAVGVASILIPSPNVADNHQLKNAKQYVSDGCAVLIEENELNLRTLLDAVRDLHHDAERSCTMAFSARKKHNKNATQDIIKEIFKAARKELRENF